MSTVMEAEKGLKYELGRCEVEGADKLTVLHDCEYGF